VAEGGCLKWELFTLAVPMEPMVPGRADAVCSLTVLLRKRCAQSLQKGVHLTA
jgi:hypothetical protein